MLIGGNRMSEEKKGFFARLKEGLTKTRDNIVRGIGNDGLAMGGEFGIMEVPQMRRPSERSA